ncbi:MAG: hypothetical protein PHQ96_08395, partial [Candidatus Omnitrophica bacterium]|nr:hypothetical protein [Candidatus Omnitrophota bacterium]
MFSELRGAIERMKDTGDIMGIARPTGGKGKDKKPVEYGNYRGNKVAAFHAEIGRRGRVVMLAVFSNGDIDKLILGYSEIGEAGHSRKFLNHYRTWKKLAKTGKVEEILQKSLNPIKDSRLIREYNKKIFGSENLLTRTQLVLNIVNNVGRLEELAHNVRSSPDINTLAAIFGEHVDISLGVDIPADSLSSILSAIISYMQANKDEVEKAVAALIGKKHYKKETLQGLKRAFEIWPEIKHHAADLIANEFNKEFPDSEYIAKLFYRLAINLQSKELAAIFYNSYDAWAQAQLDDEEGNWLRKALFAEINGQTQAHWAQGYHEFKN